MLVKKGDMVKVIAGREKGKTGKILKTELRKRFKDYRLPAATAAE